MGSWGAPSPKPLYNPYRLLVAFLIVTYAFEVSEALQQDFVTIRQDVGAGGLVR